MNSLIVFAAVLAFASASGVGTLLKGPSGIVTDAGPIGPNGPAGHGVVLAAPAIAPVALAAPAIAPVAVAAPALGLGLGGIGLGGLGLGWGAGVVTNGGGLIGIGKGGVSVTGPGTVPATIAGPAGAITAKGLWGPTPLLLGSKGW